MFWPFLTLSPLVSASCSSSNDAAIDARAEGLQLLALRRVGPYASKQPTPKDPGWTDGSSSKHAPTHRLEVSAAQCAPSLPQPEELQRLQQQIAACALGAKITGHLNNGSSPLLSVNHARKEPGGPAQRAHEPNGLREKDTLQKM